MHACTHACMHRGLAQAGPSPTSSMSASAMAASSVPMLATTRVRPAPDEGLLRVHQRHRAQPRAEAAAVHLHARIFLAR